MWSNRDQLLLVALDHCEQSTNTHNSERKGLTWTKVTVISLQSYSASCAWAKYQRHKCVAEAVVHLLVARKQWEPQSNQSSGVHLEDTPPVIHSLSLCLIPSQYSVVRWRPSFQTHKPLGDSIFKPQQILRSWHYLTSLSEFHLKWVISANVSGQRWNSFSGSTTGFCWRGLSVYVEVGYSLKNTGSSLMSCFFLEVQLLAL